MTPVAGGARRLTESTDVPSGGSTDGSNYYTKSGFQEQPKLEVATCTHVSAHDFDG
jgi:hypothetical protein